MTNISSTEFNQYDLKEIDENKDFVTCPDSNFKCKSGDTLTTFFKPKNLSFHCTFAQDIHAVKSVEVGVVVQQKMLSVVVMEYIVVLRIPLVM